MLKNGEIEKSAIATHLWKEKHARDRKPVLLKQASNIQELTNWENILITKNKDHFINFEIPPADQPLQEVQTKISRSWVDNGDNVPESAPRIFK